MKIPSDAIIPEGKLKGYLLAQRVKNDKSKFLAQAGFVQHNSDTLEKAIRRLIQSSEALKDHSNLYGDIYRVEGKIEGPNGRSLAVITVWIRRRSDGEFYFVTLVPRHEEIDDET
ncbi:MAG: hypothetical protein JXB47_21280 [Anaerolineae bacterium]|nr:hypothetical protein [Anaerolineae bacterium]